MFVSRFLPSIRHFSSTKIDLSLYLVTDRSSVAKNEIFFSKILSAVRGGVTCVQLRNCGEDFDAMLATAKRVKALLGPLGIPLIINDDVDIAFKAGADGVHIGQQDVPYHEARKILGPNKIIGLSVDSWEDVLEAEEWDVDYLGVSQLFGSKITKPDCKHIWGLEGLHRIRKFSKHRLVPIGGINISNVISVCGHLHLGNEKDGVAMVGELWRAEDPSLEAQKICALMKASCKKEL